MHALDYAVVAAYMLMTVGLGVYFGRHQTRQEFFAASSSMGWLTVGLSVMATLFSSNSFVFYPSASYGDSLRLSLTLVSHTLIAPLVLWVFIPVYARLKVQTAYEYLERRFHVSVRCLASGLFVLLRIGWMASATFAASLVVASVSGIDQKSVVVGLGVAAILYTMLGGLRAVMWTDVIQFFIFTVTILVALGLLLSLSEDSVSGIFSTYFAGRENVLFDWSPDLELSFGSWAILIGIFLEALSAFATDQVAVQRYIAAKSEQTSKTGFLINLVGIWIVVPSLLLIGVGLFGHFNNRPNELVPLLVDHVVADLASDSPTIDASEFDQSDWDELPSKESVSTFYADHPERVGQDVREFKLADKAMPEFVKLHFPPGLRGLFLAALMAAIMSSIDSGVHSITTALIVDFRDRLIPKWTPSTSGGEVLTIRSLIILIGGLTIWLACNVDSLGDVFAIGKKLTAAFGGPLLAVFLLGLFVRRCSTTGVFLGVLIAAGVTLGLTFWCSHWFPVWFWPVGFGLAMILSLLISAMTPQGGTEAGHAEFSFRAVTGQSSDKGVAGTESQSET
ncbi:MAG: sodium:solute symporter family transporter [Planctomycetota bacterium]|jgi:Na+/proline symporter